MLDMRGKPDAKSQGEDKSSQEPSARVQLKSLGGYDAQAAALAPAAPVQRKSAGSPPAASETSSGAVVQCSILPGTTQKAVQCAVVVAVVGVGTETETETASEPSEAQQLRDENPTTLEGEDGRAAWILKAADQDFVTFGGNCKGDLEKLRDEEDVGNVDTDNADHASIVAVMIDLAKAKVTEYIDGGETGTKPSIKFGSFIRYSDGTSRTGKHGRGQAIDLNDLSFATDVNPVVSVIESLDSDTHSNYGVGLPFQGDFFDADDELEAKKTAAEAAAEGNTAEVTGAVVKFTSHTYKSTGTKTGDNWTWTEKTTDVAGGAKAKLKSQALKDAFDNASGITFVIFPDNDNHMHLDAR